MAKAGDREDRVRLGFTRPASEKNMKAGAVVTEMEGGVDHMALDADEDMVFCSAPSKPMSPAAHILSLLGFIEGDPPGEGIN